MLLKKIHLLLAGSILIFCANAAAQNTAFTYQGRLIDNGNPANGSYDLRFTLYNAETDGNVIGPLSPVYLDDKPVVNGLFSLEVELGSTVFIYSSGGPSWVEIAVRPGSFDNSDRTGYTALSPRQKITPTPYSLFSHNARRFDGRLSTDFMAATTDDWVNTTGDTMTGRLTIDGGLYSMLNVSTSFDGSCKTLQGRATATGEGFVSYGGWFSSAANSGMGVYGLASSTAGDGFGGMFESNSTDGMGVVGVAKSMGGYTNYGGHFTAKGDTGCGVYGEASYGFQSYGGNFLSKGSQGRGVAGHASSTTGGNYGGYFTSAGVTGTGVYGAATSSVNAVTNGGYFKADSPMGRGVYAEATGSSGQAIVGVASGTGTNAKYAGNFTVSGQNGYALYARASSETGDNRAVYGYVSSPSGYSAFFDGVDGSANYFSRRVGIGFNNPYANLHVASQNKYNWNEGNGWGDFCVSTLTYGVSIGVATAGGGAGTVRIWPQSNHLILGSANGGDTLYVTASAANSGRVGIKREPTANALEVNGNASKDSAGDWLANSDARIKTDVQTITGALEALERVRLVDFLYTDEYRASHPFLGERRYMNVIAQEFAEVFPDYVQGSGEALADGEEILQVDTHPLTIYTAAGVQELHRNLREKESEIDALKVQNEDQQKQIDLLAARLASLERALDR